jgi:hypothetical protein
MKMILGYTERLIKITFFFHIRQGFCLTTYLRWCRFEDCDHLTGVPRFVELQTVEAQ